MALLETQIPNKEWGNWKRPNRAILSFISCNSHVNLFFGSRQSGWGSWVGLVSGREETSGDKMRIEMRGTGHLKDLALAW